MLSLKRQLEYLFATERRKREKKEKYRSVESDRIYLCGREGTVMYHVMGYKWLSLLSSFRHPVVTEKKKAKPPAASATKRLILGDGCFFGGAIIIK